MPETFGYIGRRARALWVRIAHKVLSGEDFGTGSRQISPLAAKDILLDRDQTVEQCLELMSQQEPGPEAWGGEGELHVLATLWGIRICTLLFRNDPCEWAADTPFVGTTGYAWEGGGTPCSSTAPMMIRLSWRRRS